MTESTTPESPSQRLDRIDHQVQLLHELSVELAKQNVAHHEAIKEIILTLFGMCDTINIPYPSGRAEAVQRHKAALNEIEVPSNSPDEMASDVFP